MKCLAVSFCGLVFLASLCEAKWRGGNTSLLSQSSLDRKSTDNNIYVRDEASNQQASDARASAALAVVYYGRTKYFGWTIGKSNMKKAAEKNPDVLFVTYKMSSDDAWGLDVPKDKVYQFFKNGEVVGEENGYYYLTSSKLQEIIDEM